MSDWTERNAAFSKAMGDAQATYVDAEVEVRDLQAENDRLRELFAELWPLAEYYVSDEREIAEARRLMRELGLGDE